MSVDVVSAGEVHPTSRPAFTGSLPPAPPESLEDFERLPPEVQEHMQLVATPAHVAMAVTAEAPPEVQWRPARHLMHINERVVRSCLTQDQTFLDLEVSVRHGKALALDTPVPTPAGWSTIGDLRVGDEVYDENGEPCRVVAKSPVFSDRPCFTVTTDDGDTVIADAEHEWPVSLSDTYHNRPSGEAGPCPLCDRSFPTARGLSVHMGRVHGTNQSVIADTGAERCHTSADLAERRQRHLARGRSDRPKSRMRAVLKSDSPPLPVDPWLLGFWLGDGVTVHGSITIGIDDQPEIRRMIEDAGYPTTTRKNPTQVGVLGLQVKLRSIGVLGDKHVPAAYLRASPADRLALLQGLIDSDGHVAPKGQVEFCSTNRGLADACRELVRSLGYKASLIEGRATLGDKDCGPKYRVLFYMPDAARLRRKRDRCIEPKRRDRFLTVEPTDRHDTQCIEVDSTSHLFLCGRGMIPTHNSFLVSGYLPFWYLGWFPDRRVILLSYNEDKAAEWGEFTRELMAIHGPSLFGQTVDPKSASKTLWKVKGRRGFVLSAGLGGTITGKGGDLIVIDDPIKNREEANSARVRQTLLEGYFSNVRTRLDSTKGTVVLAMARWRADDLAGTVVHGHGKEDGELEEIEGDDEDDWEVINLPAIATAPKPPAHVKNGRRWQKRWRDEIGRADGDALWPEEWPIERLRKVRATLLRNDPQTWYSLYQQSPTAAGGNEFKVDQWQYVPQSQVNLNRLRLVRWWDLAASKDSGDWTVGALIGFDAQGDMFVIDVIRRRLETAQVEQLVYDTAKRDGVGVPVRIEQEKAGAGKAVTSGYKRRLIGFDVDGVPPVGDKELRASPYAGHQQAGRCWLVEAHWNKEWVEEHRLFPKGRNDDMVDCGSGAFDHLADLGPSTMETDYQLRTPVALLYGQRQAPSSAGIGLVAERRAALARG